VAHEALRTGAIDLYPEYTGTGLGAVMKAQGATETDPQKVYLMVKAFYEKEYKLTWLKPSAWTTAMPSSCVRRRLRR